MSTELNAPTPEQYNTNVGRAPNAPVTGGPWSRTIYSKPSKASGNGGGIPAAYGKRGGK